MKRYVCQTLGRRMRNADAAGHSELFSRDVPMVIKDHALDSTEARNELSKLLDWLYSEQDAQAPNRLEMSTDHGFYDNQQWSAEDKAALDERNQMPLVYNEVKPMCDWMIGTERRNRVDFSIKPRTEDDVELADVKTKLLKYYSDVNRMVFARSRAFGDAIKGGIGWVDDGIRDDPTQEIIYSNYQNWRHVLYDSRSQELDLSDGRYIFRWRYVDEDIAMSMFPGREGHVRAGCDGNDEDFEDLDHPYLYEDGVDFMQSARGGSGRAGSTRHNARRRVKLYECQYRKPAKVKFIAEGVMKGVLFDERDQLLVQHVAENGTRIIDKIAMRVHIAIFTETAMLAMTPSPYRHNRFSLSPIFCYRRGHDNAPYGIVRAVRDMQRDLNKRASKALFMLSTNQLFVEEGAVDDYDDLRDEAAKPDGMIVYKPGRNVEIRRDTEGANGQMQFMELDVRSIQKSAGVSQENLGRPTNAVSGEAIKARQLQGSVVTTEPFDNLRYTIQVQGEKVLSLTEQYCTEEKVIRLTGHGGALDWVRVNQPEQQPDGSVRFINDITSSIADFKVDEQDYSGSLRAQMFESMNALAGRLPPDLAMRLLTMAFEYSDFPNKDAIAEQFRKITGERDPNKELTPDEQQQTQQQQARQTESLELQRQSALTALEEQRAKVREINARAAQLEAGIKGQGQGQDGDEQAQHDVRPDLMNEIDRLTAELAKAQADSADQTMRINKEADTRLEVARIEAAARERVAEIQQQSNARLAQTSRRLEASVPQPTQQESSNV